MTRKQIRFLDGTRDSPGMIYRIDPRESQDICILSNYEPENAAVVMRDAAHICCSREDFILDDKSGDASVGVQKTILPVA